MSRTLGAHNPDLSVLGNLSATLPAGDQCQGEVLPLPDEKIRRLLASPRGQAVVSDDNRAAVVRYGDEICWLLCAVADVPTAGKEVLDVAMPAESGRYGVVVNDALREAVQAARPDLAVDGHRLTATASSPVRLG